MKVSELIEQLQSMPQDAEVILQKDAEGNRYSPLHAVLIQQCCPPKYNIKKWLWTALTPENISDVERRDPQIAYKIAHAAARAANGINSYERLFGKND